MIDYSIIIIFLGFIALSYIIKRNLINNGVKVIGKVVSIKHYCYPNSRGLIKKGN